MDSVDLDKALANCAEEPIHIPGAIQPWGALVAIGTHPPHALVHASANLKDVIGIDATDLMASGPDTGFFGQLVDVANEHMPGGTLVGPDGRVLEYSAFDSSHDLKVLEIARLNPKEHTKVRTAKQALVASLFENDDLHVMLTRFCELFGRAMGAERTLVYSFDDSFNGTVIAEALAGQHVQSFMGHHFPESDIPAQARDMLLAKKVRVIPDIKYDPCPIRSMTEDEPPLDLTLSELRSVSPLHIQYCKNMGLGATVTLTLQHGGALWGLVSAHFDNRIDFCLGMMDTLRDLSDALSLKVAELLAHTEAERHESLTVRLDTFSNIAALQSLAAENASPIDSILSEATSILKCDALLARVDENIYVCGIGQPLAQAIFEAIPFEDGGIWSTDHDLQHYLGGKIDCSPFAGAMTLQRSWAASSLVALRKEIKFSRTWAGEPVKYVDPQTGSLSPRQSFDAWEEAVRNRSIPWSKWDQLALPRVEDEIRRFNRTNENERLALLARSTTNGIIFTDKNGLTTWVNHSFEEMTGYTLDDLLGLPPGAVLQGPKTNPATIKLMHDALAANQPFNVEIINYRKDGQPFWLRIDCYPIGGTVGTHGFIAIETDITEQKIAEKSLSEVRERIEVATSAAEIGIWDYDIVNNRLVWDDRMYELYGIAREEFSGAYDAWVNGLHPDDQSRAMDEVNKAISETGAFETVFRIIRGDNGAVRHITGSAKVFTNDVGAAVRMTGINWDITQIKELEEKLQFAQRMESIGKLTGGIAHDFNNIVQIVSGNTELLRDMIQTSADPSLSSAGRLIQRIDNSVAKASRLTHRLLSFSRKQSLTPIEVDVNVLLDDLMDMLPQTIGENIEITLDLKDHQAVVYLDPQEFENAIINLAVNARDAMPEGGKIDIRSEIVSLGQQTLLADLGLEEGRYVRLDVEDNGSGIPADSLNKVFEPFFTTKEFGAGSGLGLSMVYGFAKQADGSVNIASAPGMGTTVTLFLPLFRGVGNQVRENRVEKPRRLPANVAAGLTILLVEDNADIIDVNAVALEKAGFGVITARDAATAYDTFRQLDDIDIVFTDVVLPGGMTGVDLGQKCLELRADVTVLYTTGYFERIGPSTSSALTAQNTILKPYSHRDMIEFILSRTQKSGTPTTRMT